MASQCFSKTLLCLFPLFASRGSTEMEGIKEFLESTTIHGLVYISTSRQKLQKMFWMSVVLMGFFIAGLLIRRSFSDWDKNPVSTSIETFRIKDVPFPRQELLRLNSNNLYHVSFCLALNIFGGKNNFAHSHQDIQHNKEQHHIVIANILNLIIFFKRVFGIDHWFSIVQGWLKS